MTAPVTLLFVCGTRPEAIKLAPLVLAARQHAGFRVALCVTAQHRAMLDSVLAFFAIVPDFDLDLMTPGQTLTSVTTGALAGLSHVLATVQPDWMVVQGDTTTAFAAGLAAFYAGVPVAHVEAGLRTGDIRRPFPEEMNRRLLGAIAGLHFPPTAPAAGNLLREGVPPACIHVTGNTGIDALYLVRERLRADPVCRAQVGAALGQQGLTQFASPRRPLVLVTAHRRESFGAGFDAICGAIGDLCELHPEVDFLFPVHPNPAVRNAVERHLTPLRPANLTLCAPLDYLPFVAVMIAAALVLTDSGGVQEEAPSLGKPVVVMRELTERTEGAASGMVYLVGPDRGRIVAAVSALLNSAPPAASGGNFYGDGHACARILATLSTTSPHDLPGSPAARDAAGLTGPSGLSGPSSPPTPHNLPGSPAARGAAGLTGPPGLSGPSSPPSPHSQPGSSTARGAAGLAGPSGASVPPNPHSLPGSPTAREAAGPTGPSGPSSPSSPSSPLGASHPSGPLSPSGPSGPSSPPIATSTDGPSSRRGASGPSVSSSPLGPSSPSGPLELSDACTRSASPGSPGPINPADPLQGPGPQNEASQTDGFSLIDSFNSFSPPGHPGPHGQARPPGPLGPSNPLALPDPLGPFHLLGPSDPLGPSGPRGPRSPPPCTKEDA